MITVGQLAQQLLSLDPKRNPARLAFYHYLKNFFPHADQFQQSMIDSFYDRALTYQYWQLNKKVLGETIQADLEAIAVRQNFSFDISNIIHSTQLQVVNLESRRDFMALIDQETKSRQKNGENVRAFSWQNKDILIVALNKKGYLNVEVKSAVALIMDGQLQLVRSHSHLFYTPDLEFEENHPQTFQTGAMRVAGFVAQNGKVKGKFIQGTSFHTADGFDTAFKDIPELFQAIKSVERFFVNPASDPYYHNFMSHWDQSVQSQEVDP